MDHSIREPNLGIILPAEPHILITDLYEKFEDWYFIRDIIEDYIEEAYEAQKRGLFLASITCSINAVEAALKFEYMKIHREDANNILKYSTLGNFIENKGEKLKELKLGNLLKYVMLLNNVRGGYFHFNAKKIRKSATQVLKVDHMDTESNWYTFLPIDGMKLRFISYEVYGISLYVLEKMYPKNNIKKSLSIVQKDWKDYRKRNPIN